MSGGVMNEGPEALRWVGEGYRLQHKRWGAFEWHQRMTRDLGATHEFRMRKVAGEWPSDEILVTLADGDPPARPRHFGGRVLRLGDAEVEVSVYVD